VVKCEPLATKIGRGDENDEANLQTLEGSIGAARWDAIQIRGQSAQVFRVHWYGAVRHDRSLVA
jgi:hypothetical protein